MLAKEPVNETGEPTLRSSRLPKETSLPVALVSGFLPSVFLGSGVLGGAGSFSFLGSLCFGGSGSFLGGGGGGGGGGGEVSFFGSGSDDVDCSLDAGALGS